MRRAEGNSLELAESDFTVRPNGDRRAGKTEYFSLILLASPMKMDMPTLQRRAIASINCSIGHDPAQILLFCGRFFGRLILHQDILNFLQRGRPGLWGWVGAVQQPGEKDSNEKCRAHTGMSIGNGDVMKFSLVVNSSNCRSRPANWFYTRARLGEWGES